MICQHCLQSLKRSDVGYNIYDSKYLTKCIKRKAVQEAGSGDRGHRWRCGLCHALIQETPEENTTVILNVITALSEKFEIINKFQLPKLNGELALIKYMADQIAKQNEQILRKISEVEKRNSLKMRPVDSSPCHGYRRRHVNFTALGNLNSTRQGNKFSEHNDHMPLTSEKKVRYRTRRRPYSYLWNRLLHLLNVKIKRSKTKSSSKRRHR